MVSKEVSLEVGGQVSEKQYREWLSACADLTEPNPSKTVGGLNGSGKYNVMTDIG